MSMRLRSRRNQRQRCFS